MMTRKQALAKAQKRWGKTACIEVIRPRSGSLRLSHSVGWVALGLFYNVEGEGDSWDAAFAQATEKRMRQRSDFISSWTKTHGSPPGVDKIVPEKEDKYLS